MVNSYLIELYSLDVNPENPLEIQNRFPKKFKYKMSVHIPINFSGITIEEIKETYLLKVNNSKMEYSIEFIRNNNFILFETNDSSLKAIFLDKSRVVY